MMPTPGNKIDTSADGLVHEYMHNRGGPPAAWQGPIFQISKFKYRKPSLSFTRPAHRNPDTPPKAESCPAGSICYHIIRKSTDIFKPAATQRWPR